MTSTPTTNPTAQTAGSARRVARIIRAQAATDGAGVRLYRSLGSPALPELDPFLLLDEFRSDVPADYLAGFPNHPHRGFETVTYLLAGRLRHEDNKGHAGVIEPGGIQWMTAGRGIIHSEMPEQEQGLVWGFQLWVNLSARDKMTEARYQEFTPTEVPEVLLEGGSRVRVIAGVVAGIAGVVRGIATNPLYLDVALAQQVTFQQAVPSGHNACCYVFEGVVDMGGKAVQRGELAVLTPGETVTVRTADAPARFLLIAAQPLNEPIARYGPFVMNTQQQIQEAFQDYRAGRF
ncbi:pirin family protein [Anthocerotibacter panamensis]|uniref:pirin family protein n=1 Tax=Anthocerotibacter panamensis TaxID=2857077 RepID=UPI001C405BFA|nr:pirin family protein [Anthocerotibacter panamensis]